jgi:hypothetical protein
MDHAADRRGNASTSLRKTPSEIESFSEKYSIDPAALVYASRMSAKVDNTAVQDSYQLYHHVFVFTMKGHWSVIQQGMNSEDRTARRYHWLGDHVKDFVAEPHQAVCCDRRQQTLNPVAAESEDTRNMASQISRERPQKNIAKMEKVQILEIPKRHEVTLSDIDPRTLYRTLLTTYEKQPENFEKLLGLKGVGPKTMRALSLISEIIYGKPPSYRDPARFSFANGGKDGTPFPVDRETYDKTIDIMKKAVQSAKIGNPEKLKAIRQLVRYYQI